MPGLNVSVVDICGSLLFTIPISDEVIRARLGAQIQARRICRWKNVTKDGKLRAAHIFVELEGHHLVPAAIHRLDFDGCFTRSLTASNALYEQYLTLRAAAAPGSPHPSSPIISPSSSAPPTSGPSSSSSAPPGLVPPTPNISSSTSILTSAPPTSHPNSSTPTFATLPSTSHPNEPRESRKRERTRSGDWGNPATMRAKVDKYTDATGRNEASIAIAEERLARDKRVLAEATEHYEARMAALGQSIAEVGADKESLIKENARLEEAYNRAIQARNGKNCVLTRTMMATAAMDKEWEALQNAIIKEVWTMGALAEEIKGLEAELDS
ncbi:hypothetical protein BOTBODRAFT_27208 [Botryobasidium botryosum FD-172 SS1]|uniref:Uncharacterized protein n=1 Tax=Botryobasidium botryosum (strain FD-172 SS1) TaxID=930990 RepID=A0A067MW01_BOTB1|nr:hypothetical protein BOTBODRAFT_27208 [Botryobasidium botryosum FD-172 SS1]